MLVENLEQMKRKDADKDGKLKIMPKDEVKAHRPLPRLWERAHDADAVRAAAADVGLRPSAHDRDREAVLSRASGVAIKTATREQSHVSPRR